MFRLKNESTGRSVDACLPWWVLLCAPRSNLPTTTREAKDLHLAGVTYQLSHICWKCSCYYYMWVCVFKGLQSVRIHQLSFRVVHSNTESLETTPRHLQCAKSYFVPMDTISDLSINSHPGLELYCSGKDWWVFQWYWIQPNNYTNIF